MMLKVLLVDDNPNDRFLISRLILKEWPEAEIREVGGSADFHRAMEDFPYTAVVTDYHLRWSDGLEVLARVRERDPHVPVIMVTGTGTEEVAVRALKNGLSDYLLKRHMKRLPAAISECLEKAFLKKQVEEAHRQLLASERRYRMVVESASDWIFTLDLEGRYTSVNKRALEPLGLEPGDLIGKRVDEIHGGEEGSGYLDRVRHVIESGKAFSFEHEFHWGDRVYWHLDTLYPLLDEEGRVEAVGGTCTDITEQKNLERAIRESEERYRILAERSPVGVIITQEARFIYVNNTLARLLGRSPEELQGRSFLPFIREDYREFVRTAHLDRLAGREAPAVYPLPLAGPGEERWLEVHSSLISHEGRPAALGIVVDITERIRADRRKRLFEAVIEQASEGIIIADGDGVIQYVNPAFLSATGYGAAELERRPLADLSSGVHEPAYYEEMWKTVKAGKVWTGDVTLPTKAGGRRDFEMTLSPVRDGEGRVMSMVAICRDVTQERALEAQLIQAQKMEALGTLAGGIAHDFNNILGAIVGYTELARMEIPKESKAHQHLERVLASGRRARDLVQQILTFSRQKEMEKRPVHLRYLIKEAVKMLRASIPSTIEIREYAPSEVPPVLGDPTQLHQVVMNLCTNAYHAMREAGGELELRLEKVCVEGDDLLHLAELREGEYVVLTVRDTGCGIPHEILDRIFEPYFTTKEVGEGTGLGLAVVHGIVRGLNGAVRVESRVGEGTTFRIYLPALLEGATDGPATEQKMDLPRGTERVLVVDDEPALVEMARQILTRLGYQVTGFSDPREALARFQDAPHAFDLVITDMTMPKITGRKLAHAVRQVRRDLPVILTSGYSNSIGDEEARQAGFSAFLKKPYGALALSQAVRRVLDDAAASRIP
jgi:PAS domain S-box-containing protein